MRLIYDSPPVRRVSEPPSPPAPLTFQPRAPWAWAISIIFLGFRADQGRVQPALDLAVIRHGLAQFLEVAGINCIARAGRGLAQIFELLAVRPGIFQAADDHFVHVG